MIKEPSITADSISILARIRDKNYLEFMSRCIEKYITAITKLEFTNI